MLGGVSRWSAFAACVIACSCSPAQQSSDVPGYQGTGAGGGATGGAGGSGAGGDDAGEQAGADATGGAGGAAGTGGVATEGGASDGAGGSASACTGKPGGSGVMNRTLMVGTVKRTYELYFPANVDPNSPVPIVFAHHGFTMSGDIMRVLTDFTTLADQEGFIVAFPDGVGTTWSTGPGVCGAGAISAGTADDFGFVTAMLDDIESLHCIDRSHVYTTGFSMGGYFSNYIGCEKHDIIRAVAPASGGGPPAGCTPGPVPVMILHGTSDPLISYSCGVQARDEWVAHNGCSTEVDSVPVKGGTCDYNKGCPPGGQVVLCSFNGMGHGWAGHVDGIYGGGTQYEDATKLVWDFFKQQK